MSGSLSTELSYESLRGPSERDTSSTPDEHIPAQAAELPEPLPDFHADTTSDPQPDNRLSVVSAVSLEPRRRSRHHHNHHHHSRHSHLHRELAHMLSVSSRDAKELRRGLSAAFDKLDQSRVRASHAEKLALDMLLRVREAEQERANAMRHSSTVREELGKYKALLDNAHGEIRRAQQMLQDQEELRYEAESTAARARDNARLMKQRRLVDLAREQGRKIGYNEGIQAGQRIGYEGPTDDGELYQNEGARFREMFDESKYRLDEFDQSPPFRDAYLNHDTEVLPTPLPRRQVYPRLDGQLGGAGSTIDANNMVSEAPYTPMSPAGVQRTSSADSSSTTTLPAVPTSQHVSSRAGPPMPTIPEVPSTEVGSGSWRSKSLRDSPRSQNHIQPATNADVHPSAVAFSQSGAAFEPPPGIVADTPSGFAGGNLPDSDAHFYESPSPRRAFDNSSVLNNGIIPDVSRSPVHENFSTATGAIRNHEREHSETSPEAFRSPARGQYGAFPEATQSPARGQFEPMPGAYQSPAREHFEMSPGTIPSPVQERVSTNHPSGTTRDSVRFVGDPRNSESSTRPSSRQGVPPPRRDGPPRQYPMPQMPAPLAPQSGADVSYAYGPRGTAERGRPSEPYSRIPRDASRNAASSPAPNYAPQSGAEASNSYGPRGTAQRGRPSESYNRMPRDASQNGASNPAPSFAPQSGANASYAYGPHNTPQRGRPPESHNRVLNPAPNIAPQSGANAPDAYGSYSTAQRGRPSEPHSRMPRDAGLNTASNGASDFAPQSSSSVPYTYGSHGTAQRRQPSESDSRMPRDAGFNAPSNPSLNAYTPNFAERPTDRAQQEQRTRGMSPRISGEQLPDRGAIHDPHRTTAPPVFNGDSAASRPRTPQNPTPNVHVQIPPTRYYTPSSASPHLTTPPATGSYDPHGGTYSSGATSPNPNVRVSSSPNQSPVRFPPTLYNEPNLQRHPTPGVDYERERRVSTPVLPIPSRTPRGASPGRVHSPSDFFSGGSYTPRPRSIVTSPHTPTDTLPVRAPSVSPRPTSAAYAQPIPPPQGAVTPRRAASPNALPRGASPAPLFRASSPAPLPIRSPSVLSHRIHRSTSDVSIPGAPGSPYMHYNPNLEADIAVLASSSVDKV